MPDEDQMIAAIYAADRADGSAILGASMNLMAVITAYGGIVVAALHHGELCQFVSIKWDAITPDKQPLSAARSRADKPAGRLISNPAGGCVMSQDIGIVPNLH